MLYDIPGRTGVTIAPETFARVAANEKFVAVKDAVGDLFRGVKIMQETGLSYYSGDDVLNLGWLTHGAAGVVSVVGHVAGEQYADMVARVDAGDLDGALKVFGELVPIVDAIMGQAPGVMTAKAAMQLLGVHDNRAVRLPLVEADEALVDARPRRTHRSRPSPLSHPHPELSAPPALPAGGLRVIPLGGLGEVGRNMTVFEYDGRLLIVDCGVLFPEENHPGVDLILPDFDAIRDRLDEVEALVLTHGHEDHIGAVPYLLRERSDIPLVGLAADPGAARHQAARAPDQGRRRRTIVAEGDRISFGPFDLEFVAVNHSIPDALAVAIRTGAGHGAAHRRLQDGPAAARRPDHRPARLRPAGRGGRRPVPDRLDQRRGPRFHHLGEGDLAGPRAGLPHQQEAHHRGLLRLARAPRAAGDGRRRRARPQGRLRRPARWCATWASPATSATSTCPPAC